MKKQFPWGLTFAFLLGLAAALPLLRGIPEGTDSLFHLYRTVQISTLIENGTLFSRWAPDMVYGYGYPLFNYYAPLSYYLATAIHFLGLSIVGAVLVTLGGAFVVTSIFTYLWVRDLFGEVAGLVATVTLVFSPYMMINALHRGALAEQVALALLPVLFWCLNRFVVSQNWHYAVLSSVTYAALILSHNITALVITPILLVYSLLLARIHHRLTRGNRVAIFKSMSRILFIFLIGLSLAAFYWLPAFFERDLIQLDQAYLPGVFNYEQNFLKLRDLFAPPVPADPNLVQQDFPISLSLIAVVFAVIALVAAGRYRNQREQLVHIFFAGVITIFCGFLTLGISRPIWDQIPLLYLLQFPWRFVGISSLFVAFLAGVGVIVVVSVVSQKVPKLRPITLIIPLIVIFSTIVYAIPWRFVDYHVFETPITMGDSIRFEQETGMIGTTATGEYLPNRVEQLPQPQKSDLNKRYARLKKQSLPDEARILSSTYSPLDYSIRLETPVPFKAIFNTFFFEGWSGEIDGRSVPVSSVGSQGLIGVNVPAGDHQLTLYFGDTRLRQWAGRLSWLGLLMLPLATVFIFRHGSRQPPIRVGRIHPSWRYYVFAVVLLATTVGLRFVFLESNDSLFKRSRFDGQQVTDVSQSIQANFDNKIFLLGMDDIGEAAPDEPYEVTLYWRVTDPIDQIYSTSIVIVDDYGNIIGQNDNQFAGNVPTTEWDPTEYAPGDHRIRIDAGTPPGEYQMQIRVYQEGVPDNRLDLLDVNGAPSGQTLSVGTIKVSRPTTPPNLSDMDPEYLADVDLGNGTRLVGYTVQEETANGGDKVHLTLFWEAIEDPTGVRAIKIYIAGGNNQKELLIDTPLIPFYPEALWQEGDIWRITYPLVIPATLPTAIYTVTLATDDFRSIDLDTIKVSAPDHLMEQPVIASPMATTFSDLARLEGFDHPQLVVPGQEVPITLVWRSLRETQTNYKTFVHLIDSEGRLVVGSDAVPSGWQRPTTGWIFGEYIVDPHSLVLPEEMDPGTYQLSVGIYDTENVQRLRTAEGDDAVILINPLTVRVP